MDPTFELFLNGIRQFLTDAQSGELSNEDEEYLRILADIKRNLENLKKTRECDHTATLLLNVCQTVLYSDYISVKINTAVFSQKINEVKEAESKGMPEILQPKMKEIKGYLAKLSELIKDMDNLSKKIHNKINDFGERNYRVTDKEKIEVEFLNIDFETAVEKTSDYFKKADHVLKMFELNVADYKEKYKDKAMAYGGFAVLACGVAAVVTCGVGAGLVGTALAAGGTTVALTGLVLSLAMLWKGWAAKRNFCDKLLLILRDYRDLIDESQLISLRSV